MTADIILGAALAVIVAIALLRTSPGASEAPSHAKTPKADAPAYLLEDLEYSRLDHLDLDHRLGRSSLEDPRW